MRERLSKKGEKDFPEAAYFGSGAACLPQAGPILALEQPACRRQGERKSQNRQ